MHSDRAPPGAPRCRHWPRFGARLRALAASAVVAGCTYQGYIDQPVTIKLTWYSYLAGDDIREACVENALPRYRLVYNGRYQEQLRSYEVAGRNGLGAKVTVRVLGPMRAVAVIRTPLDLQAPWQWTTSEAALDQPDFAAFEAALDESGLWRPLPAAIELHSSEFYWVASGCRDGRFVFNAWRYGTPGFAALTFPERLAGYDETGIEVNPPRPLDAAERIANTRPLARRSDTRSNVFVVRVGPAGLVGMGPLL